VVNASGTTTYSLCGADLLSAFGSGSVPTMASTGFSAFTDPQGGATLTDAVNGVSLADTGHSGANVLRNVCKTAPAAPYTVTAKVVGSAAAAMGGDTWAGIGWRNNGASGSTKLILAGMFFNPEPTMGLAFNDMTDYQTYAGTSEAAIGWGWPEVWF